jgi:hypothetical protein
VPIFPFSAFSDIQDLIASKRKQRAALKSAANQDKAETNEENVTQRKAVNEFENKAFVNDLEDENGDQEEEGDKKKPDNAQSQNAILTKHRDKSRELATTIKEDDPNKVSERIKGVQDRVRDKLKPLLKEQLEKARQDKEATTRSDLQLDLGASSSDLNLTQSRLNASEKAREIAEQRLKKIKVRYFSLISPSKFSYLGFVGFLGEHLSYYGNH